jgi:DNA modification methylase
MTTHRIIPGDCIAGLRTLPDASVHCCVTSPPYWGLRDYGHDGQIGLESTPEAYVARMVEVFREVRRVLRQDGTCWVNLGDSYAAGGMSNPSSKSTLGGGKDRGAASYCISRKNPDGLKPKDLVGIPWRVAFALQADGWWLRQDIIWHKPNPMPESVTDRCTKAHEYVFLLTKSERYYYDAAEIAEKAKDPDGFKYEGGWEEMRKHVEPSLRVQAGNCRTENGTVPHFAAGHGDKRNRRSVWTVTTKPYSGAHFAVMPPDLVEPCIKAGCPEGGTVLDPFAGSGTTLAVAAELGRNAIGCELNPEYIALAERRIKDARSSVALFEGAVA